MNGKKDYWQGIITAYQLTLKQYYNIYTQQYILDNEPRN